MEIDLPDENSCKPIRVSKLIVKEGQQEKAIFVKIIWRDNDTDVFHIKIFDGDNCWSGRFSREFAREFIKETGETEDIYYKSMKNIVNGEMFTYEFLTQPEDSAKFSWKKSYGNSNIFSRHGTVPVHKTREINKDNLIEYLLNDNKKQNKEIVQLNNKVEEIAKELENCKTELENFVSSKISTEQILYEKFANLLNSKKRRIAVLEESLLELTDPHRDD